MLVGQPPSAGSLQGRLQETRPPFGLGVRVPEDRQPHYRDAPHPDHRIAVSDDLLLAILDNLVRLDRPGRIGLTALLRADFTGRVDRSVQFVKCLTAAHSAGGRKLDLAFAADGEALGRSNRQRLVEDNLVSKLCGPVRVEDAHRTLGADQPVRWLKDHFVGCEGTALESRLDIPLCNRASGLGVPRDGIGLEIELVRRQAVLRGYRRRGRGHGTAASAKQDGCQKCDSTKRSELADLHRRLIPKRRLRLSARHDHFNHLPCNRARRGRTEGRQGVGPTRPGAAG